MFKMALSGGEVVRRTYEGLTARLDGDEFRFPEALRLVIGDDSDHHRTRVGYMQYASGDLIATGGKRWCLALGQACGAYPARPYDCDILAIPVTWDWKGPKDIEDFFKKGSEFAFGVRIGETPFGYTALLALANGELRTGWQGNDLARRIGSAFATPDFKESIIEPGRYRRKIVPKLIDALPGMLSA